MTRRISRPANKVSKEAAESISNIRRAAITDAVNKELDASEAGVTGSVAHSPSFKKSSMMKQASIIISSCTANYIYSHG